MATVSAIPTAGGSGGASDHGALTGLSDDDHLQYLLLAGRAGGQSAIGGTGASEELVLRGTANANLGLIRAQSPIDFDDVTAANALSPYSVRDASTASFTAPFIGGTFADLRVISSFTNSLFIYETLRGSPTITSGVNPAFAAFTLFNALPVLRSTSFNPLQALILNAGGVHEGAGVGSFTAANNTGVNFVPQIRTTVLGATMTVTSISGLVCSPVYSTVAGSTANFGAVKGLWCRNINVALFGSSAGVETLGSYIGLDVDNITFGGNVTKAAVRSAQASASNAYFLLQTGNAQSELRGQLRFPSDLTGVTYGASGDLSVGWAAANFLFWQFNGSADQLRFSNPSSARFLFDDDTGAGEFNFNCARFSMGAQTGAVGNQVGVFVAGTRSVSVGGEWSDFLLTQGGNITLNAAMSGVFGWTINAPSITLGTGSVTTAAALRVGGNVNQGTNRYGLSVISNPSGGTLNYCARFEGAAGVRVDGVFEHTGTTVGFYGATPAAQSAAYTPSNVTTDRTYDANSTTLDEIADVLGTLIADLQNVGLIG